MASCFSNHGWNDQQIAAQNSIDYYESVVARMGGKPQLDDFYRLFMVPGMMHCFGGEGTTDRFDTVAALEQWVERGVAPSRIIATHQTNGSADRTRPLCPYPQTAQWKGSGSTEVAENLSARSDPHLLHLCDDLAGVRVRLVELDHPDRASTAGSSSAAQ